MKRMANSQSRNSLSSPWCTADPKLSRTFQKFYRVTLSLDGRDAFIPRMQMVYLSEPYILEVPATFSGGKVPHRPKLNHARVADMDREEPKEYPLPTRNRSGANKLKISWDDVFFICYDSCLGATSEMRCWNLSIDDFLQPCGMECSTLNNIRVIAVAGGKMC